MTTPKAPEKWALLDMDSSLADFEAGMKHHLLATRSPYEPEELPPEHQYPNPSPAWLKARKVLIKKLPGFWATLPVISFGMELYHAFDEWGYKRMILTKGPWKNPAAWMEKVQWCQEHVPDADITITHDKGLVYGKVLYDDYPPYIERWLEWRPRGKVLMLDSAINKDFSHPNVLRVHRTPLAEQEIKIKEFLDL